MRRIGSVMRLLGHARPSARRRRRTRGSGARGPGTKHERALAGIAPAAVRATDRGVPAAAVRGVLARPPTRSSRRPRGGASSGSANDGRGRSAPEIHDQQPIVGVVVGEEPERERRGDSTAPSTPPGRCARNAASSRRSAADRRAARTPRRASRARRNRACTARRSPDRPGSSSGAFRVEVDDARKLRQELARGPCGPPSASSGS